MDADLMCSSTTCPIAGQCRRHAASGREPESGQRYYEWNWRLSSWSDRVVCNGLETAPKAEAAHG